MQLYIAFIASFNFPKVFIPKGQIHPSCNSHGYTPKCIWHNKHSVTIQSFLIQFLPSHKGHFLSTAMKCRAVSKYLSGLRWFTDIQTLLPALTSPWLFVCLLLGGYFLVLILHRIVPLFPWKTFVHISAPQTLWSQHQFSSFILAPLVPLH